MSTRWQNLCIYFNANILPNPISEMLTMNTEIHDHFTRNRKNPHIQYRRTQIASKTLRHQGPIFWYKIPSEIKAKQTVKIIWILFEKKYC